MRRFFLAALVAGFGLAACGDSEPTQRKAFMEFLQTRILDKPRLSPPKPSEEETKSFGSYAKHYEIILGFYNYNAMDKKPPTSAWQILDSLVTPTIGVLMIRPADLDVAAAEMSAMRKAFDAALAKADTAHATLKQPDELKVVFDKAYELTVTAAAKDMKEIFPLMEDVAGGAKPG